MSNEICLGVLGLGRMGMRHCENISSTTGLKLAAGSSRSESQREKFKENFDAQVYDNHFGLLDDPRIQWIVIATYTSQHKEWSLEALRRGKSLIIEKPIALSYAEADEILIEADRQGQKVTVFQNWRWEQDYTLIRRVLDENLLGDICRIESRITNYSAGWGGWGAQGIAHPWRLKKQYGGGVLLDFGPHLFDQLTLMIPSPIKTIFGKMERQIWSKEVDDHFWAEILFANGISARVEASNNHRIPLPRWCIIGAEGTLQVSGEKTIEKNTARIVRGFHEFKQEMVFPITKVNSSEAYYREFSKYLHQDAPLPVSKESIRLAMKLIDAVRRSSDLGEAVIIT